MSSRLKIATIGGGSSYTPELIEGLIKRHASLPVSEYWLTDIEEGREKLEIIGNLANRMVKAANVPIQIFTTLNRKEALQDADFVTTQIRVGFLDARIKDESIPLEHGMLGQETNGAGGMFKAFRTIPVLLDIAEDMSTLCPNAWLINFTNPAGIVTEALINHSSHKKTIGLCNVPIHMQKNIVNLLNAKEEDVQVFFGGLNHMVYGLDVFLKGSNVTNEVLDLMLKNEKEMSVKNISQKSFEPEFLKALGVIPCPYHNYYYKKDEMLHEALDEFKKGTIRGKVVQDIEKDLFLEYKDVNLDIKPPHLEKRGGAYYSDAACSLIDSIYNDKKDIQTVNIKNNGTIYGIDDNSAVEASCVITKNGPKPLTIGKLPTPINGLVQQIKSFEKLTIEAAIEGSVEKAILALTINPLTTSDITAKTVVLQLLQAHKQYLPQFFKK